jgi:dihydrodipicolinate synthase/N-acetylneuraminate lyase
MDAVIIAATVSVGAVGLIGVGLAGFVAYETRKIHEAVNSERAAMVAKIEALHATILRMAEERKA